MKKFFYFRVFCLRSIILHSSFDGMPLHLYGM